MGYMSRNNRRPNEYASSAGHTSVINEPAVNIFLERCALPPLVDEVEMLPVNLIDIQPLDLNPIDIM